MIAICRHDHEIFFSILNRKNLIECIGCYFMTIKIFFVVVKIKNNYD